MTIGKSSRKSSARSSIRAPKFLDKSSGFYGRLDEPEVPEEGHQEEEVKRNVTEHALRKNISGMDKREDPDVFGFNEGMMEDDGESLLQRNTSRRSSRWRRSSRRKQKEGRGEEEAAQDETPGLGAEGQAALQTVVMEIEVKKLRQSEEEKEEEGRGKESSLVHFPSREDEDDQVLIRDKKRGREEEGEEERRMKKEQEEGMKMLKRSSVKNYRKVLDRAFRRGWEAFITNLYSVTLTPVTSSSSPSSSPPSSSPESKKETATSRRAGSALVESKTDSNTE